MQCPSCQTPETRVLETRIQATGDLRRRRECLHCKMRFTTIETLVMKYPFIVKRDGSRELFSPDKLRKGIHLACMKRSIRQSDVEKMVQEITQNVLQKNEKEIHSAAIGQFVMKGLRQLDHVAYIRFASVYKSFKDVDEFVESLRSDEKKSDNMDL
jgi:transcriptional repressor NrdR